MTEIILFNAYIQLYAIIWPVLVITIIHSDKHVKIAKRLKKSMMNTRKKS